MFGTHHHADTHNHYYITKCDMEGINNKLNLIISKINNIMTNEELTNQLNEVKAQVEKVQGEIQSKLDELATAIENQDNTSPEVESALAGLQAAVTGADNLIADLPTGEPPVEG